MINGPPVDLHEGTSNQLKNPSFYIELIEEFTQSTPQLAPVAWSVIFECGEHK